MKRGAPTTYTDAIADDICAWIGSGKSLASYVREHDVGYTTVTDWLVRHEDFAAKYARAREAAGDADADVVSDIRDRCLAGQIPPDVARVAIDAAKWSAGKRKPKVYGDKLDLTSDGERIGGTMTEDDRAARVAALLVTVQARLPAPGEGEPE